jgi:hypothetical protein
MKIFPLLSLLMLHHIIANAQLILPLETMNKDSVQAIEKRFISAYDTRTEIKCAFPKEGEEVEKQWRVMHTTFQKYLTNQGFTFLSDIKIFLRFYFNTDGTIAHAGYVMRQPVTNELREQFEKHLGTFSASYNFGMIAQQPYAQCGNVIFQVATKK